MLAARSNSAMVICKQSLGGTDTIASLILAIVVAAITTTIITITEEIAAPAAMVTTTRGFATLTPVEVIATVAMVGIVAMAETVSPPARISSVLRLYTHPPTAATN